jgi:hypothetical protein
MHSSDVVATFKHVHTCRVLIMHIPDNCVAGTTEQVVQAAPRLPHASYHVRPRLVGSSATSHMLPYAYTYESICDEEEAACA